MPFPHPRPEGVNPDDDGRDGELCVFLIVSP